MATYEEIRAANATIKTTAIRGKDYAEVNQRIKAFRMVYPMGYIMTELVSDGGGICLFRATVGVGDTVLGTGTAFERQDASPINKTSYIENCETSAVGRALGMAGFGIDTSVASAEEVDSAIRQQEQLGGTTPEDAAAVRKATPKQVEILSKVYTGENLKKLLELNNLSSLEEMPVAKASELISKLNKRAVTT